MQVSRVLCPTNQVETSVLRLRTCRRLFHDSIHDALARDFHGELDDIKGRRLSASDD